MSGSVTSLETPDPPPQKNKTKHNHIVERNDTTLTEGPNYIHAPFYMRWGVSATGARMTPAVRVWMGRRGPPRNDYHAQHALFDKTCAQQTITVVKRAFLVVISWKDPRWCLLGASFENTDAFATLWLHNLVSTHKACRCARRHTRTEIRDFLPELNKTIQITLIRLDWNEEKKKKRTHFCLSSGHGMCYITAGDVNNVKQHCIKRFFHHLYARQEKLWSPVVNPLSRFVCGLGAGHQSSVMSSKSGKEAISWVACPRRSTGARRALNGDARRALTEN